MSAEYHRYVYEGPIVMFDKTITSCWSATTSAPSEAKAKSNFEYQAKKACRLYPSTKISLPGKIKKVD